MRSTAEGHLNDRRTQRSQPQSRLSGTAALPSDWRQMFGKDVCPLCQKKWQKFLSESKKDKSRVLHVTFKKEKEKS